MNMKLKTIMVQIIGVILVSSLGTDIILYASDDKQLEMGLLVTNQRVLALKGDQVKELVKKVGEHYRFANSQSSSSTTPANPATSSKKVTGVKYADLLTSYYGDIPSLVPNNETIEQQEEKEFQTFVKDFEVLNSDKTLTTVSSEQKVDFSQEIIKNEDLFIKAQIEDAIWASAYKICIENKNAQGKPFTDVVKWRLYTVNGFNKLINYHLDGKTDYKFAAIFCTDKEKYRRKSPRGNSITKKIVWYWGDMMNANASEPTKEVQMENKIDQCSTSPEARAAASISTPSPASASGGFMSNVKGVLSGLWRTVVGMTPTIVEKAKDATMRVADKAKNESGRVVFDKLNSANLLSKDTYYPKQYVSGAWDRGLEAAKDEGMLYLGEQTAALMGSKVTDATTIINDVKKILDDNKSFFTKKEREDAEKLISEAEKLKSELLKKLDTAANEQEALYADKNPGRKRPKNLEEAQARAEPRIISEEVLARDENRKLQQDIIALKEIKDLPHQVQVTSESEFSKKFQESGLIGSKEYLEDLFKKMLEYTSNFRGKNINSKSRQNALWVAASGPGTGKTTGLKNMAQWAGIPFCMITGESLNKQKIPEGKTAFDVFLSQISECLTTKFVVDEKIASTNDDDPPQVIQKRVVNGIILLDDFHYVLNNGGLFSVENVKKEQELLGKTLVEKNRRFEADREEQLGNEKKKRSVELSDKYFKLRKEAPYSEFTKINQDEKVEEGTLALSEKKLAEAEQKAKAIREEQYKQEISKATAVNSRKRFFTLLKEMVSGEKDSFLPQIPSKGNNEQSLDLDLSHAQLAITLNNIPYELNKNLDKLTNANGDSGNGTDPNSTIWSKDELRELKILRDKLVELKASSPTEEDRKRYATHTALPEIKKTLSDSVKRKKFTEEEENIFNIKLCEENLYKIVDRDVEIMKNFGGELGIRGLAAMVEKYTQFVKSKIFTSSKFDKDFCSLAGNPEFNIKTVSEQISDYNKLRDEKMAREKFESEKSKDLAELKFSLDKESALSTSEKLQILRVINSLEENRVMEIEIQKQKIISVKDRIAQLKSRIVLPDPDVVLNTNIEKNLLYLKPTTPNSGSTALKPYNSAITIVNEIYNRMQMLRSNDMSEAEQKDVQNRVISLRYTDPDINDASVIDKISDTLGKVLPVCHLNAGTDIFITAAKSDLLPGKKRNDFKEKLAQLGLLSTGNDELFNKKNGHYLDTRIFDLYSDSDEKEYYGFFRNGNFYLLLPSKIDDVLKNFQNKNYFIPSSYFYPVKNIGDNVPSSLKAIFSNDTERKPALFAFWDNCLQQFTFQNPVFDEGLIVIHASDSEVSELQKSLVDAVNSSNPIVLSNGKIIDPRKFTIVVSLEHSKSVLSFPDEITMSISPPPTSGRKNMVDNAFLAGMTKMKQEAETLFGKNHIQDHLQMFDQNITSQSNLHRQYLEALTKYDREFAEEYKKKTDNRTLSSIPLELAVKNYLDQVGTIVNNPFGSLSDPIASVTSFIANIDKVIYKKYKDEIIKYNEDKRLAAEKKKQKEADDNKIMAALAKMNSRLSSKSSTTSMGNGSKGDDDNNNEEDFASEYGRDWD